VIVVDTNVTSELMKPAPSTAVSGWISSQNPTQLYTTSITVAEVLYGIARLPQGHRRTLLETAARGVFSEFVDHVLPFDAAAAEHYADVVSVRERSGAPIDGFDAQIAAICRVNGATLATRNGRDFRDTGIDVVDPWR
jgi:toxin FitB